MNRSLLIVDDEETIRWALRELFMAEGWEVHCAGDGDEADALVAARPYDFMITDLKMPGVCGVDLIRRARRHNPPMGVMVLTGYASLETALEALRLRAWDYVTKPCKVAYLKERIEAFFADQASRGDGGAVAGELPPEVARPFLDGEGVEVFSFEGLDGDEESRRVLEALREVVGHAGLGLARAGQLVQLCVEAVALADGRADSLAGRVGLLNGHLVITLRVPGLEKAAAERWRQVAENLRIAARLVDHGEARSMVMAERI